MHIKVIGHNDSFSNAIRIRHEKDENYFLSGFQEENREWQDGTPANKFTPSKSGSFNGFPYLLLEYDDGDLTWRKNGECRAVYTVE